MTRIVKYILLPVAMVVLVAGCGVKSSPKPPIRERPEKVSGVDVEPKWNAVYISWKVPEAPPPDSKFTRATRFDVQRRSRKVGDEEWDDYEVIGSVGSPDAGGRIQWRDENVAPGYQYQYRIVGIDEREVAGGASKVLETQWALPPPEPVDLRALPSDHSVVLRWNPPPGYSDVQGYFVYRAEGAGNLKRITDSAIPRPEYFDAGLKNGAVYRYAVSCAGLAGTYIVEGPTTQPIQTAPRDYFSPQAPIGVAAFAVDDGVKITWWPNGEPDLEGYYVYRTFKGETVLLNRQPLSVNYYLDEDAIRPGAYEYTVVAIDKTGNASGRSIPAEVFIK